MACREPITQSIVDRFGQTDDRLRKSSHCKKKEEKKEEKKEKKKVVPSVAAAGRCTSAGWKTCCCISRAPRTNASTRCTFSRSSLICCANRRVRRSRGQGRVIRRCRFGGVLPPPFFFGTFPFSYFVIRTPSF